MREKKKNDHYFEYTHTRRVQIKLVKYFDSIPTARVRKEQYES